MKIKKSYIEDAKEASIRGQAINTLQDKKLKLKAELSKYIVEGPFNAGSLTIDDIVKELIDTNHKLELLKI